MRACRAHALAARGADDPFGNVMPPGPMLEHGVGQEGPDAYLAERDAAPVDFFCVNGPLGGSALQLDFQARELTVKLVYYGPALSGKTTNLQAIHRLLTPDGRGRLMTLETRDDRTLFFDLLPLSFNTASGLTVRIKLFTVPGQVIHNSTRKLGAAGRRRRGVHRRLPDPGDPRQPGVLQGPASQPARERARPRQDAAGHPVQQTRPAQHPHRGRHHAHGCDGQGADVHRHRHARHGRDRNVHRPDRSHLDAPRGRASPQGALRARPRESVVQRSRESASAAAPTPPRV